MALVTAPLGRRDNFPYRKLDHREIRLLVVKKHSHWPRQNSLTCSIQHMTLPEDSEAPVPYTALSYTWGDGKDVTGLKLRDESSGKSGEITVTSSLILALQTILEAGKRHIMWIDQLCIDQSSAAKKGQQVQLMRWIYERATSVHIWLGSAADGSDEAMLYLRKNDGESVLRDASDPSKARFTPQLECALKRLFDRPYWTRTWTMQEATALGFLQIVVSCGHRSVSIERIFDWAMVAIGYSDSNLDNLLDLTLGGSIYALYGFWHRRRIPVQNLSRLVERVRILKASDPRDKIYSMLNFATDIHESEITPDYTKTVRQAYTELALWTIGKYRCLDILGDCPPSHADDVPSWVPDWSRDRWMNPFFKTSDAFDLDSSPLYRASGGYICDLEVRNINVNTRLLSLSEVRIADLAAVINTVLVDDTRASKEIWQPENGDMICPLNMIHMREVFRRTIYLDIHVPESGDTERGNTYPLPWDLQGLAVSRGQALTMHTSSDMCSGRCPFHTKSCSGSSQGLLGLSLTTARPGDELWIVKGGKMPFILRPKAMTIPHTNLATGEASKLPVDAGMPTYELVGEAFVLGLMDGEVIDMLGETPKRERPPPLADTDRVFRTIGLI